MLGAMLARLPFLWSRLFLQPENQDAQHIRLLPSVLQSAAFPLLFPFTLDSLWLYRPPGHSRCLYPRQASWMRRVCTHSPCRVIRVSREGIPATCVSQQNCVFVSVGLKQVGNTVLGSTYDKAFLKVDVQRETVCILV